MIRKLLTLVLAVAVIVSFVIAGCAKPAPAPPPTPKPVVLKAVSFQPEMASSTQPFLLYIEEVNKRAKGELRIDYLGAGEVVPRPDLPAAVKKGVVDVGWIAFTFYGGVVPIGGTMMLTELSSDEEERESGAWDYARELHEKAGLYWIGRAWFGAKPEFILSSTKRIKTLEDFVGLSGGSGSTIAKPFIEALGMAFVQIPLGEVYTALERGVLDCYFVPIGAQIAAGTDKVARSFIDHPVYGSNTSFFVGLDKWNQLPKHLQDLLVDVSLDTEHERNSMFDKSWVEDRQKMIDAGAEPVKLSPDEAEKFVEMAYQAMREEMVKKFPETAPKLLELISK